jgi:hypothetical protein
MTRPSLSRIVIGLAALAVLGLGVATAVGAVTVYDNDFSTRGEFREIKKSGGGKRCDRNWRKKQQAIRAAVKRSPTTCSFRPPVQGDRELPNHDVTLDGKILAKTAKSMRGGAFLELTIRAGGGGVGYALRVFPHKRTFELRRGPRGGGFPVRGKSAAIKKINQRNRLRLVGTGAVVRALVNGKEVARVNDGNPGQVTGRKMRFAIGSEKKKSKPVVATFKKIAVAVPDP